MSQIQPIADAQAFADIQVEQELQDTIDEAYIPDLPEEEEVQRAIPGTFELTPGANAELNLQNVSSYIENALTSDIADRRFHTEVTPNQFFQFVTRPDISQEGLWAMVRLATDSLSVPDLDIAKALNLVQASYMDSLDNLTNGNFLLYIRSYRMQVRTLARLLNDWETKGYQPSESQTWFDKCVSAQEDDAQWINIRYVGQCRLPSTPADRFESDIQNRHSGLLANFYQSVAQIAPEVLRSSKIFVLRSTVASELGQSTADDYERMLIGLLGYYHILNRQHGGFHDSYTPESVHVTLLQSLATNVIQRWIDGNTQQEPSLLSVGSHLSQHFRNVSNWVAGNSSLLHKFSGPYLNMIIDQATPRLYKGHVLCVCLGNDVTVEDFFSARSFFDSESPEPHQSRAGKKFLESIGHMISGEGHRIARLRPSSSYMTLFPLTNLFPWIGKQFQAQASEFLRRYVEIAAPMLMISMGDLACNITGANFLHSNGLQGKVTSFVGLPKLVSWAGEEWLDNDDSLDPPEDTLAILLPHFDPGQFKHLGDSRKVNKLYHLCWQVTFVYLSQLMNFLDSRGGLAPTAQLRKAFLQHVMSSCTARMEQAGLVRELNAAREDLQEHWKMLRAQQMPITPQLLTEERSALLSRNAMETFQLAETSRGAPGSSERQSQVNRLWRLNLPVLHVVWSHSEHEHQGWHQFMLNVGVNKYFAAAMYREKQRVQAAEAGDHPLAHILRHFPPPGAQDHTWMMDDDLVRQALQQKSASMLRNVPSDFFSSERQRARSLQRFQDYPTTINGATFTVDRYGRFYIHWRDPDFPSSSCVWTLQCKKAYSPAGATRSIHILPEGLALKDESGDWFVFPRQGGDSNLFMNMSEMRAARKGPELLLAWRKERDVLYPEILEADASPISSIGQDSEEEISHISGTSITHLYATLYPEIDIENVSGISPNLKNYQLPVHISDGVVPFKRFLDDYFPQGGTIFLGENKYRWPQELKDRMIWKAFRAHLYLKSSRHQHFRFWRDIIKGRTAQRALKMHLSKLRPITQEQRKQANVIDELEPTRPKMKRQGALIAFGAPNPGAEPGVYRT